MILSWCSQGLQTNTNRNPQKKKKRETLYTFIAKSRDGIVEMKGPFLVVLIRNLLLLGGIVSRSIIVFLGWWGAIYRWTFEWIGVVVVIHVNEVELIRRRCDVATADQRLLALLDEFWPWRSNFDLH